MKTVTILISALVITTGLSACVTSGDMPKREAMPLEAARTNLQLASEYMKRGQNDRALEKLKRAIEQDPDLAPAHAYLGYVYEKLGKSSEAEQHYKKAVRVDGSDANVRNMYAVYLCRNDRISEAEKHFVAAAQSANYTTSEAAYTNAGLCVLKRPDSAEQAEKYFRLALQINPSYPDALWQLAKLSNQQGRDLPARAFLQRLAAANTLSAQALWLGVQVERQLGDNRSADQYAQELRLRYPESVEARNLSDSWRDDGSS